MTPEADEFKLLLGNEQTELQFVDPLAGTNTYSHPSDSLFWRIDHWLPSRSMETKVVPKSVQIAHPLPMEQMIQISDHLPIVGKIDIQ
jgi:hypothetical protein